jgi:hypothetical protein
VYQGKVDMMRSAKSGRAALAIEFERRGLLDAWRELTSSKFLAGSPSQSSKVFPSIDINVVISPYYDMMGNRDQFSLD